MSSLGDILLAHNKRNEDEKVSDPEPNDNDDHKVVGSDNEDKNQDISQSSLSPLAQKIHPERIEKNDIKDKDDTQSNASSTDDYVRELLDPDDRPRNVWHVVEGPKVVEGKEESEVGQSGAEVESDINSKDGNPQLKQSPSDKKSEQNHREKSHRSHRHKSSRRRDDDSRSRRHRDSHRRSRSRSRSKTSSRRRDRSRERGRDRSDDRDRGSDKYRGRSRSNSLSPITKRNSRTILIMQLNPKVVSRDLEEFFSVIGRVKEVRLIMDSRTRRHKGIAYIEFEDSISASKAFALNGENFFGAPIVIQSALNDKSRSSSDWHSSSTRAIEYSTSQLSSRSNLPPNCYRIYVGGLHVNLTEEMIKSVFEPFGPIVRLELMKDRVTNISRGYAFITYSNAEDGKNAVQSLDGFELAGKALRVSKSMEKNERNTGSDNIGRGTHHHDGGPETRTGRTKDVTTSLYELADRL